MGIDVRLEDNDGVALESIYDVRSHLPRLLRRVDEGENLLLNGIDFYGDTVFNRVQSPRLLEEWDWLTTKTSSEEELDFLNKVRPMIERCRDEVHRYLKFIGD